MKLLALILAFACYADANADQTFTDRDGGRHTVSSGSARNVATGYSTSAPDSVMVHTVYGCNKGYGTVDTHSAYVTGTTKGMTYLGNTPWGRTHDSTMSVIAVYICAQAK